MFCGFSVALQTQCPAQTHSLQSLEPMSAEAIFNITREYITWLTLQLILMTGQARLAVTGKQRPPCLRAMNLLIDPYRRLLIRQRFYLANDDGFRVSQSMQFNDTGVNLFFRYSRQQATGGLRVE